jgi:hypothetical protein
MDMLREEKLAIQLLTLLYQYGAKMVMGRKRMTK